MKVGQAVHIPAKIIRVINDSSCPDWLELRFFDAHGAEWTVEEKAPVVTCEVVVSGDPYLGDAVIAGIIVGERTINYGRQVFLVDTEKPWGIEAKCGATRFEMFAEHLTLDT